MDWKDLGSKIANYAPTLGSIIGSVVPGLGTVAGGAAGLGIKALASAFGLTEDATPEQINQAIQQDPQSLLKLKVAEMDYNLEMRKQDIEEIRVNITPYLKELDTKTVPWVDALHKMGRQITNYLTIIVCGVLLLCGKTITPEVAFLLSGGNIAYQVIKGKGN